MASKAKPVKLSFTTHVDKSGAFQRPVSQLRNFVKRGSASFPPATGRYHLYISHACPWANRTMVVRALKGLEDAITVSTVHPLLTKNGWHFDKEFPDHVGSRAYLRDIYFETSPEYDSTFTVPVLYDKEKKRIVNNESSEIIRMLNSEFNDFARFPALDLYPEKLSAEIDAINSWIYSDINNGVYRTGFASSQAAHADAYNRLFKALDRVEALLSDGRPFLVGGTLTEADIRLWTTLVRFDAVYHTHFKCNWKRIADYSRIQALMLKIYAMPGVGETVVMPHIKFHYFASHEGVNPHRLVPPGPELSWYKGSVKWDEKWLAPLHEEK